MTEKYFKYPFADQGDREAVPDDRVNTLVNYQFGYTPEYELNPDTDPDGNFVGRHRFNQVMYDMTAHAKKIQDDGYTLYFADVSYKKGRIVVDSNGDYYRANQDVSGVAPPSAEWDGPLSDLGDSDKLDGQHGSFYRDASNLNSGTVSNARLPNTISSDITGNAATADDSGKLGGKSPDYYITRQATQQEALKGDNVEAYMPPNLVHAAFNQYGLGAEAETLADIDALDTPPGIYGVELDVTEGELPTGFASGIVEMWRVDFTLVNIQRLVSISQEFDNADSRVFVRRYYKGNKEWTPWRELLHDGILSKATTAQAQAGTDDEAYMTPSTTADVALGGRKQTWQDMTSSRELDVTYTNSTGKPIYIVVTSNNSGDQTLSITVDGIDTGRSNFNGSSGSVSNKCIVPVGSTYSASISGSSLRKWYELR